MLKKIIALTALAMTTAVMNAADAAYVYICGQFNNWNPKTPAVLTPDASGIYCGEIDFSTGKSFKMSTVKGTTGDGWSEFDKGTLAIEGTVIQGQWLNIVNKPTSANQTAPAQVKLPVKVDLDKMLILFGEAGESPKDWSGTLPLLFINTEGGAAITSKETYINASWYLDPLDTGVKALGTAQAPLTMQIRGRGNYTWTGFDKKPYRLKLTDKQPMMGMPSSKHWALLAHADDNRGFLRNFTGLTLSSMMQMPWTPGSQPCEVILNGDYIGLYFLTETIRVASSRVDIVEQKDLATTDVDGGWLVEIDNYDTDPHVTIKENGNYNVWFTYKSPEELSSEQGSYLLSQMQAIDNAIYKNGTNSTALESLVDFDVLARYYIVQEIVDDTESFHGSCYLNRQRGALEKWKFGPVWDFGNAFNRDNSQKFIYQDPTFHQVWIGGICKFPTFQEKVKELWGWFLGFGPEQLDNEIETFSNHIATAASYDARRWPNYGNSNEESRAQSVRNWLKNRISWLKTQWGSQAGVENIAVAANTGGLKINVINGVLTLESPVSRTVCIHCIDGRKVSTIHLAAGEAQSVSNLTSGLYIVGNQKVAILQ